MASAIPFIAPVAGALLGSSGKKGQSSSQEQTTKIDPRLEALLYGGNIDGVYHPGAYDYLRNEFQKGTPQYYPGETVAAMNPMHRAAFGTALNFNNSGQALAGYNAVNQQAMGLLNKGKKPGDPGYMQYQAFQPDQIDPAAFWAAYDAPRPQFGRQPIPRTPNDLQPGMVPPLGDGTNGQGGVDKMPKKLYGI